MALCMMLSVAALADEPVALNWEDFEPALEAGGVTGQFYTFDEISIKMWLPDGINATELTDEDKANGYIGYFMPDDQSGAGAVDGVTEVETGTVNGFPCVTYKMPEQDSVSVTFTTEAGYALEVTCTPLSVENADLVWGAVIASIQAE